MCTVHLRTIRLSSWFGMHILRMIVNSTIIRLNMILLADRAQPLDSLKLLIQVVNVGRSIDRTI